jgi:hypothetical protein
MEGDKYQRASAVLASFVLASSACVRSVERAWIAVASSACVRSVERAWIPVASFASLRGVVRARMAEHLPDRSECAR